MSFYDDASLVVIPSAQKTSKLYAVKPTDGSGDLAFTRTGDTATRVNSAGLIEKVRTNRLLQSNTFSNAAWSNTNVTLTSGQQDPFGGTTGWRYLMTVVGNSYVFQNFVTINGAEMTLSFWVKSNTGSSQTFIATANSGSQSSPSFTATTSWQRFSWTFTSSAGNSSINLAYNPSTNCDLLIYGAQFETGVMTDYIPTTTAAVSVGPVANVPRLDYLGSTCPRLLLEPQRTNLVTYSEQLDNAAWTKVQSSITANNGVSPDGYANADKFIANTTSNLHFANSSIANVAAPWTYSVFAKAAGYDRLIMWVAGTNFVGFNLTTGVVESTLGTGVTSAKIENYGNGWYRCSITSTSAASGTSIAFAVFNAAYPNGNVNPIFTGNGTDGILIYGAQFEAGAYATSYIPTLAASATRGAEKVAKTGISSLIGQTEGTIYFEINKITRTDSQYRFNLSDGTSDNWIFLGIEDSNVPRFYVRAAASTGVDFNGSALSSGTHKLAAAYKQNDFVLYIDGVQIGSDTSGNVGATSQLHFGGNYIDQVAETDSRTAQALLFKTRLTNAQLAELTTL